jgi:hypothetical protein
MNCELASASFSAEWGQPPGYCGDWKLLAVLAGRLKVLTVPPNVELSFANRPSFEVRCREWERLGCSGGSQRGPRFDSSARSSLGLRGAGGCLGQSELATVTLKYADGVSRSFCSYAVRETPSRAGYKSWPRKILNLAALEAVAETCRRTEVCEGDGLL